MPERTQFNHVNHRWNARWLAICLLVSLPAFFSGYVGDDYFFESPLHNGHQVDNYYSFVKKGSDAQLLPWWRVDDFGLDFFRPLSSASLFLDFNVWNSRPLFGHLQSIVWFVPLFLGACQLRCLQVKPLYLSWHFSAYTNFSMTRIDRCFIAGGSSCSLTAR